MTVILSLAHTAAGLYAAGPDGLFKVENNWLAIPQPQQQLTCCAITDGLILVGGLPHGIAFSRDEGQHWQASWLDGANAPALCLAPAPKSGKNGLVLAGTDGAGLLRSVDNGRNWTACNFGLQSYTILDICWAPSPPADRWPAWDIVFAATEEGLYRSPNGGAGWRRCTGAEGLFQSVAVGPDFHTTGRVLAGTVSSGVWYSMDYGRHFQPIPDSPQQINALTATSNGWMLSDETGLWVSSAGLNWQLLPGSRPALVLLATNQGLVAGDTEGVFDVTKGLRPLQQ